MTRLNLIFEVTFIQMISEFKHLFFYWCNAAVFYFDNISFLEHLLNQLFLPNESSVGQASYRTVVLTICFQLFKNKPFYGGKVVE